MASGPKMFLYPAAVFLSVITAKRMIALKILYMIR